MQAANTRALALSNPVGTHETAGEGLTSQIDSHITAVGGLDYISVSLPLAALPTWRMAFLLTP
ncbi:MAG: hypothetical protein MO846_09385 [Candidatus Devosia symbiotica]|nr:hypothetical protein [Candidatus Devosia symbiotica]